jgi:hypothetical protein
VNGIRLIVDRRIGAIETLMGNPNHLQACQHLSSVFRGELECELQKLKRVGARGVLEDAQQKATHTNEMEMLTGMISQRDVTIQQMEDRIECDEEEKLCEVRT